MLQDSENSPNLSKMIQQIAIFNFGAVQKRAYLVELENNPPKFQISIPKKNGFDTTGNRPSKTWGTKHDPPFPLWVK